jgi:hypothetical protein
LGYTGIVSRLLFQSGNEIGVGKKSHIKDQLGVVRYPVFESEADQGNVQNLLLVRALKVLVDEIAEIVNGKITGIDDQVG